MKWSPVRVSLFAYLRLASVVERYPQLQARCMALLLMLTVQRYSGHGQPAVAWLDDFRIYPFRAQRMRVTGRNSEALTEVVQMAKRDTDVSSLY